MSYKTETIAKTIDKLNESYFLPAIQREFVWSAPQIIQLFDSLLRGYPISSFLFWSVEPGNRDKWKAYRFLTDAKDGGTRNDDANISSATDLHLVLDGQQRLTSLNIGLRGHYTVKKKYGRADNPQSWSKRKLYLDILHDPTTLVDPDYEDNFYRFEFMEAAQAAKDRNRWLDIGTILRYRSDRDFEDFRDEFVESLEESHTRDQRRAARMNLDRLYRAVHKDDVIAYYVENEQDYDRVLDVFVRANSGGTKLSKSDLLMSTVTASWGELDARAEIQGLVLQLNMILPRRNEFDKDFVMKTCLVVNDLPVKYRVQNFNHANLVKIKDGWVGTRDATLKMANFVRTHGLSGDAISASNVLIPIIYFYSKRPDLKPAGTSRADVANARAVHAWTVFALVRGAFRSSADSALSKTREVISKAIVGGQDFPLYNLLRTDAAETAEELLESFVDEVLDIRYGQLHTKAILSLLYSGQVLENFMHVDHIFPRSSTLTHPEGASYYEWNTPVHELANLCLLSQAENQEKTSKPFAEWIKSRDESFLQRHFIPSDPELYELSRFDDFREARASLIEAHLKTMLAPAFDTIGA